MAQSDGSSRAYVIANGEYLKGQEPGARTPSYNRNRLPDYVWQAEQDYLRRRRQAAGKSEQDDTIGLALSGGGIRSASFNLGFVQALMVRDSFKNIDYLSTVSGGGYLGGFLAARMADLCQDSRNTSAEGPAAASYQDYVMPRRNGEQTRSIRRLLRSGRYLKRVPHFINRYLFGVVIVNLWLFLSLAALGAGSAWAFRWVDSDGMINFAKAAGFSSDISRAFVPALGCFLLWFATWVLRYAKQIMGRTECTPFLDATTRILAIVMIILAALGAVSVFVTQDVSLPVWSSVHEAAPELTSALHTFGIVLLVLQIIALVPLLRLDKVIQSGTRPRGVTDSLIFNIVGPAIVFGIPLLAFGWFARENVSGIVETAAVGELTVIDESTDPTPDQTDARLLCFPHIPDWEGFWTMVQQRAAVGRALEVALLKAANPDGAEDDLQASIDAAAAYRETLEGIYPLLGLYAINTTLDRCEERDNTQRQIVNRINRHALTDLRLFENVAEDDPPSSGNSKTFPDWLTRAQALGSLSSENAPSGTVAGVNRNALQAYFGSQWLRPPGTVFARATHAADESYRFHRFWIFLGAWVVTGLLCINANFGSLQEFYRERLQYMWLPRRKVKGAGRNRMLLSTIAQPAHGPGHDFPYLLINATAHVFRGHAGTLLGQEPDKMPRETRFEFTPNYCGYSIEAHGGAEPTQLFQRTDEYENQLYLDLPGIMAISGSAVSPAMTENFVLKTLLFLTNLRLGQWVQQPGSVGSRPKHPKILPCLSQIALPWRGVPKFLFLSDGGHHDNLGLEALLDRGLKKIICVDAGHDPRGCFTDFLKVLRRSRFLDGVRIKTTLAGELGFADLARVKGCVAGAHFFEAKIAYPDETEGVLYYVKPSFDLDEPAELITYRDENPDFPHDPTLDQFFDERRFESYRALGWHIGEKLVDTLNSAAGPSSQLRDAAPTAGSSVGDLELARQAAESVIHKLARHLDAPLDVRRELLMGIKEELFERQLRHRPVNKSEREAISRFLLNYSSLSEREPWEDAVLFDCITDLLTENPDVTEAALNGALQDERLRGCANRLFRAIRQQK